MQDRFRTLFLSPLCRAPPNAVCSTPLCPEEQEPKPPPWPQEGFRAEAPYREPLQPDSPARMELTGKNTPEGLRAKSEHGRKGKGKEICCSGGGGRRLGEPNF